MKIEHHDSVTKGKLNNDINFQEKLKYFESKKIKITMTDSSEEKRTIDQNSALWRWDTLLSKESGYTVIEMHYEMCCAIFGVTIITKPDGSFREVPKRTTSNLTKAEWQDYIRDYRVIAREVYNYEMPPFSYEEL